MNNTITSGLINYPLLYFNHYHQQEIVDQIISTAKRLYAEMYSEEDVVSKNVDDEDLEENTLIKVIDYSAFRVNKNAIWVNSPSLEEQNELDLKWMYTKELRNIVANMSKVNLPEKPCVYIFRSVPYDLLSNAEFVSYLYKYLAFHERWHCKQKDANINWTIALIVPSGELPPPSIEGVVRLVPITPPDKDEIMSEIDKVFKNPDREANEEKNRGKAIQDDFCKSLQGLHLFDIRQIIQSTRIVIGDTLSYRSVQWARDEKQQIIRKTGILDLVTPNDSFKDIGGLENLKADLHDKATIFKHLSILQDKAVGCQIPKGMLLIGMPGCGKTMIAKAVASEFELPLLRLDIGKLLGQYVGQSETNLRRALDVADSAHPCVLWIDEIEKAFAGTNNTSGENNDLMMRLMGTFLTWMQERKNPVYIVATANDVMKPEFMRKGRFDEVYFVDFPNLEERVEIAQKVADGYKDTIVRFDVDWWTFSLATGIRADKLDNKYKNKNIGLTGAEIRSLINCVVEKKYIERINKLKDSLGENWERKSFTKEPIIVTLEDFGITVSGFTYGHGLTQQFMDSAMVLQSKSLFKEKSNKEECFIDKIYSVKEQYQFKSATKEKD